MKRLLLLFIPVITFIFQGKAQDALSENASQFYNTFSKDGAWCWFSDPRAVYLNGKIYSGWVAADGSIIVASYNQKTGETKEVNIYPQYNKDDHANPSFLILPDKRIMIFFSAHSTKGRGENTAAISYATTKYPEDINEWEDQQHITENSKGPMNFCYTNPVMLSKENNRIYLFWRGGDWKPTFCYTDDKGKTWSKVFSLLNAKRSIGNRPYIKITGNGIDEIHFSFTDGHPRNEPLNSIYYVKYKAGKFFKADGTEIGSIKNLPIKIEDCDIVYDAKKYFIENANGVRAWIWDIAISSNGNPVIAYSRLPTESEHQYWYATWNGSKWIDSKVSDAGAWFPRYEKNKNTREPEPHYSGGISIDHENPQVVYYSKPVKDIFEIFKSQTNDQGKSWKETAITSNSKKDNVRPSAIKGAGDESPGQVLWMYNERYSHYTDFNSQIKSDIKKKPLSAALTKAAVKNAMQTVADWQLDEPLKHELGSWPNGALYAGMVEWAKMADDSAYFNYLKEKGNKLNWAQLAQTDPRNRYHADDYATGQMFVEMYRKFGDKKMITPMERYFNFILAHPSTRSLKFNWDGDSYPTERWSWCDALFMAPTVWAKMAKVLNREDYLNFMHAEYTFTYNYLYDKEEHLFFRDDRYFIMEEVNGSKIFWGRGNGWVIAGLPTILEEVPADWKEKKFYEKLFVEMASKIASLQDENGYWHASLLDPGSYPSPETSSSAFFTYSIAWGINNGYLDTNKYRPIAEKGWQALVKAVYPDGRLGWVQPIGADPKKVTQDMTEVYGVGAFLLAGTEMYKMVN